MDFKSKFSALTCNICEHPKIVVTVVAHVEDASDGIEAMAGGMISRMFNANDVACY